MAAGATYEPIATTTLGSTSATITFSGIASSWTDLRLVFTCMATTGGNDLYLRLNNDGSTLYSQTYIIGTGAAAQSQRNNVGAYGTNIIPTYQTGLSSSSPQLYTFDLFSYAGSTYKTVLGTANQDANGSGSVVTMVSLYRSTSAITRLDLTAAASDTFKIGTTATLFGIKAA